MKTIERNEEETARTRKKTKRPWVITCVVGTQSARGERIIAIIGLIGKVWINFRPAPISPVSRKRRKTIKINLTRHNKR